MSTSFEFDAPERFTTGTIGEPGHRIFFLQAAQQGSVATLRLEKQQVAALAEYLAGILADLPDAEDEPDDLELIEPAIEEWVVGALAVAYEEASDRILLVAEELVVEPDDDSDDDTDDDPTGPSSRMADEGDDETESATARFRLSRDQVSAFIRRAAELVVSGRPICPLCLRPIDPEGHACPRLN
jgi:uncharacterized repeat protein (TIGR03847 family)